ncbi:MAG: sigma-70 family RNA polymerase sigma factor [Candidatus Schekmanbacteria bacterium]|nr:sigma-70 family RNA polymerase sigma factor [Candidatus Schekmanbacteria bacterium]
MANEVSDAELMRRYSAGEAAAFDEIVRRYQSPLFRFLKRCCGSSEDAVDLVQETFVHVFRAACRYDPERSFRTWIFTIARRLALDHAESCAQRQRGELHRPAHGRPTRRGEGEDPEGALPDPFADLDSGVNVARAVAAREAVDRLAEGVSALPGEYREIFLLRYEEDLELQEIADILGISVGAAKVRLHRARERLRELLGSSLETE